MRLPRRVRPALAAFLLLLALPLAASAAIWQSSSSSISMTVPSTTLGPPTGVSAGCYLLSFHVTLNWTPNASPSVTGYTILRATSSGGPYSVIGSVSGGSTATYNDGTVAAAGSYWYEVESTNHLWTSAPTTPVNVVTIVALCL